MNFSQIKAEMNSSGNSTTSYTSSSSSPTSQSSSSSEQMMSTPIMTPNLSSLTYTPQSITTPESVCCGPNISPICPIGSVNMVSLPFKLRHKAKNNNADSDSGSDTCVNVLTDITSNHCVINNNVNYNDNNTGSNTNGPNSPNNSPNCNNSVSNDSLLKSENYALRSELQRLATEVASLKNVLVFSPTQTSIKTISPNNESLHCNSYEGESRSDSPNLKSNANDVINGSNIISNETQSH